MFFPPSTITGASQRGPGVIAIFASPRPSTRLQPPLWRRSDRAGITLVRVSSSCARQWPRAFRSGRCPASGSLNENRVQAVQSQTRSPPRPAGRLDRGELQLCWCREAQQKTALFTCLAGLRRYSGSYFFDGGGDAAVVPYSPIEQLVHHRSLLHGEFPGVYCKWREQWRSRGLCFVCEARLFDVLSRYGISNGL